MAPAQCIACAKVTSFSTVFSRPASRSAHPHTAPCSFSERPFGAAVESNGRVGPLSGARNGVLRFSWLAAVTVPPGGGLCNKRCNNRPRTTAHFCERPDRFRRSTALHTPFTVMQVRVSGDYESPALTAELQAPIRENALCECVLYNTLYNARLKSRGGGYPVRGSLYERQPGVWLMRVYTGQRDAKGHPVQRARTFRGGKREAESALAKFVTEVEKSQITREGARTVGQLLDRWLLHIAKQRTPQTVKGYKSKIESRLKPALGKMRLDRLRAAHIDQAMASWGEELSPATVRQLYAILAAALHQAHKWGWVDEIVTKKASPPKVERRPDPVPSPDEIRALLAASDGVLAAGIALAAATGCRRGELCALRWSDIDLERGVVTVARSLGWVGKVVEGGTKTHQVRRLALDDFGLAVVKRRMAEQGEMAAVAGVPLDPDPYLLSRSAKGALPCLPDGLSHGFTRVCKKLGMDYHFHQLRHWAATMALSEGHDVRTVAGRLGHADASTTLKVYAHVVEARDQEIAGTLGRMLKA